jgi:brassinosteroid insensitive 1-associated receptor kinase 1
VHSQLCRIQEFIPALPASSECDFSVLPECDTIPDCAILSEWLPDMFDSYTCCRDKGVICEDGHIVTLDLSLANTGRKIFGTIPIAIGDIGRLQKLYLQNNFLDGNLPISLAAISSLQTVDVTNNFLSGVIPFNPSFNLIGIETNLGLSLPANPTITEQTKTRIPERNEAESSSNFSLIHGVVSVGLIILMLVILVVIRAILLKRRKQGKETVVELKLLPKYSSPNKQIRLIRKLNSGGFGVVWEARYKAQTVAMKLIRKDKYKEGAYKVKFARMVSDEALVMELMIHERIVRFVMFEIESLGIVLEYLPLGSLDGFIGNSKGFVPWRDRYQMILDICEGMEFLHSNVYADGSKKQVLFHQDLKSGNVLLSIEGNVLRGKISDFGLSCKFLITLTFEFSFKGHSYKPNRWESR